MAVEISSVSTGSLNWTTVNAGSGSELTVAGRSWVWKGQGVGLVGLKKAESGAGSIRLIYQLQQLRSSSSDWPRENNKASSVSLFCPHGRKVSLVTEKVKEEKNHQAMQHGQN